MLLGFNYPGSYNRFGNEIGPICFVDDATWDRNNKLEAAGNTASIPLPALFDHVDRNLANLKKLGFQVIRWFLLGNGNSYGPAPIQFQPLPNRAHFDYHFTPPAVIDKRFRRDFEELLRRFQKAEMQIIPSLISFEFGSSKRAGLAGKPGQGYGGRADVIRDKDKRKVFLDTMLAELLAASAPFKSQIYAWEVINEPCWLCSQYGPLSIQPWISRPPEVTDGQMSAFLEDAVGRINKAGFPSTVGHRYFSDLRRYPTGTVPQFHYYAEYRWYIQSDPDGITGNNLFSGNPKPILGEFDSAANRFGDAWTKDLGGKDSTVERLKLLDKEGCDLAMLWPDFAGGKSGRVSASQLSAENALMMKNDVIKLLEVTRMSVAAITKGTLPPSGE